MFDRTFALHSSRRRGAFTLVELLVVIVVLAITSGVVVAAVIPMAS